MDDDDARATLTEAQRAGLLDLLYWALIETRARADGPRAASLADALHNVPHEVGSGRLHWAWLRDDLARHQREHPGGEDYVARLARIAPPMA